MSQYTNTKLLFGPVPPTHQTEFVWVGWSRQRGLSTLKKHRPQPDDIADGRFHTMMYRRWSQNSFKECRVPERQEAKWYDEWSRK